MDALGKSVTAEHVIAVGSSLAKILVNLVHGVVGGESWPTAAIPMRTAYCSCEPTRVRSAVTRELHYEESLHKLVVISHQLWDRFYNEIGFVEKDVAGRPADKAGTPPEGMFVDVKQLKEKIETADLFNNLPLVVKDEVANGDASPDVAKMFKAFGELVSHGLQLQSLLIIPAAAVS